MMNFQLFRKRRNFQKLLLKKRKCKILKALYCWYYLYKLLLEFIDLKSSIRNCIKCQQLKEEDPSVFSTSAILCVPKQAA